VTSKVLAYVRGQNLPSGAVVMPPAPPMATSRLFRVLVRITDVAAAVSIDFT